MSSSSQRTVLKVASATLNHLKDTRVKFVSCPVIICIWLPRKSDVALGEVTGHRYSWEYFAFQTFHRFMTQTSLARRSYLLQNVVVGANHYSSFPFIMSSIHVNYVLKVKEYFPILIKGSRYRYYIGWSTACASKIALMPVWDMLPNTDGLIVRIIWVRKLRNNIRQVKHGQKTIIPCQLHLRGLNVWVNSFLGCNLKHAWQYGHCWKLESA